METRRSKRPRPADEPEEAQQAPPHRLFPGPQAQASEPSTSACKPDSRVELSLQVKWTSGGSPVKTRINRLTLKPLEDVDKLGGLSKGLMDRAFPAESRPEYLTDEQYYRWTPDETCLSYPLDVTKTEFKLVALYDGWEYVVMSYELGNPNEQHERKLFVTAIEFESVAVVLGNLGIRVSLVAYPVICVRKTFLDDISEQIRSNPDFTGILS